MPFKCLHAAECLQCVGPLKVLKPRAGDVVGGKIRDHRGLRAVVFNYNGAGPDILSQ